MRRVAAGRADWRRCLDRGDKVDAVRIIVNGEPRPKQSYRALKSGGGYQPKRVKDWQDTVAWEAKQAMRGHEPIKGAISVSLVFSMGNNRRTDLDNLSKGTLDAMRGIVYEDDVQIVDLRITKRVDKINPGVIIQVSGEALGMIEEAK